MKFGLRIAFLLLLVTGTVTVKGSDLSDALDESDGFGFDLEDDLSADPNHQTAADRPKRWSGFSVFDTLRGNRGSTTATKPTKPTADPKPSRPAAGNSFGFNLEDALRPAVKPTDKPTGGYCQGNVIQKLGKIIENQDQELRLLLQLMGRSTSKPMH